MKLVRNFIESILGNISTREIMENDKEFVWKISATEYLNSNISEFQEAFTFLQQSDQLNFSITFGDAEPISFYSATPDLARFKAKLGVEYSYQENEPINATLTISKKNSAGNITIYDLHAFEASLTDLDTDEIFAIFDRAFATNDFIVFNIFNLDKAFGSTNIFFLPIGEHLPIIVPNERLKSHESLMSAGNYNNITNHRLTPEDFKIKNEHPTHSRLSFLFDHLSDVLSVIYLFDITTLKKSELEFKINGYKSIKGTENVKFGANNLGGNGYFSIYNWVYLGGNLNDKIGLARNIISLHFKEAGKLELKGNPFQSIQSSYKVYEKQNVKQYIEIRNKISEQLLDFSNRANKLIESFASGFQKSGLALITFFMTTIIIRIISKGQFSNIFTLDTTVLSIAFLIGSFIYYRVSRWEVIEQRKRFVESYNNMKERYTDLLDKTDIERILNNNKEFNTDLRFIDSKLRVYSNLWKGLLVILLLATLILFVSYNLTELLSIPLLRLFLNDPCHC